MRRAVLYLGLFLLFGVSVAFLMQRVMDEPPADMPAAPADSVQVPADSVPDVEPPAPPSDSTGTGWHDAPPDSVPPPDPVRPHPGRGHDKDKEGGSA